MQRTLLSFLPQEAFSGTGTLHIVPISYYHDYEFRRDLRSIIGSDPWCLIDYTELGLDWDVWSGVDSMVLGRNVLNFLRVANKEWLALNDLVRDNPPKVYFKRELLAREQTDWLVPVDFPCYLPLPAIETKEQFDTRPLDAFTFWGLSHPARPRLHGEIFKQAYDHGYEVLSQFGHWHGHFYDPRGRTWAAIHAPHFDRKPIEDVMHFNHRSKISVSLPGAGYSCFRDTEAPVGSIPAFWHMPLARAFPWIHGRNCIDLRPTEEWRDLYDATKRDDLYDIYISAQANIQNYQSHNYVHQHILPAIERRL